MRNAPAHYAYGVIAQGMHDHGLEDRVCVIWDIASVRKAHYALPLPLPGPCGGELGSHGVSGQFSQRGRVAEASAAWTTFGSTGRIGAGSNLMGVLWTPVGRSGYTAPVASRQRGVAKRIHRTAIDRMWPEALAVPINPETMFVRTRRFVKASGPYQRLRGLCSGDRARKRRIGKQRDVWTAIDSSSKRRSRTPALRSCRPIAQLTRMMPVPAALQRNDLVLLASLYFAELGFVFMALSISRMDERPFSTWLLSTPGVAFLAALVLLLATVVRIGRQYVRSRRSQSRSFGLMLAMNLLTLRPDPDPRRDRSSPARPGTLPMRRPFSTRFCSREVGNERHAQPPIAG